MSDQPTTLAIITVLVNALMQTRDAGASNEQIIEAAVSTMVTVILNLHAEEEAIGFMPHIQEQIYHKWQKRMAHEGVGQARH